MWAVTREESFQAEKIRATDVFVGIVLKLRRQKRVDELRVCKDEKQIPLGRCGELKTHTHSEIQ